MAPEHRTHLLRLIDLLTWRLQRRERIERVLQSNLDEAEAAMLAAQGNVERLCAPDLTVSPPPGVANAH